MLGLWFFVLFVTISSQLYTSVQSNPDAIQQEHCDALTGNCQHHKKYLSKQKEISKEKRSDNKEGYVEQAYTDDFVHGGIDDHYDPGKLENIIPVATLNRKKLKMLGATGYYIRDFSGDVYEYVINGQWEGVWVHISFVRIRIYGQIGEGRWRFAFSGVVMESESDRFPIGMNIVVKSVNDDVLKEQKEEESVKRALQAQTLARKIAHIASKKADAAFGKFPEIIKVWMFRGRDNAWMIEEKLEGLFKKLINNDMSYIDVPADRIEDQQKAAALAHFSYEFTEREAIITDLQGVGLRWTDVEIATKEINDMRYFGIGNLGRKPHKRFKDEHICTKFCKYLHLPKLAPRCAREGKKNEANNKEQPVAEDSTSSGYNAPKIAPDRHEPLKNQ